MVSLPLPWPKPAVAHELLGPPTAALRTSDLPSRLFAAQPTAGASNVEVYERAGRGAAQYGWSLDRPDALEPLMHEIAAAELGALGSIEVDAATLETTTAQVGPTFLVCIQGSHDQCCGTAGVALADQIEASRSDYRVRRVSHTGGHRFAPTLMAFPEGRMWAFADLELVDRIATGSETVADFCDAARGWWGARVGPAQVAEGAVRAETKGAGFDPPMIEAVAVAGNSDKTRFHVTTSTDRWQVDVTVARHVPSIACETPGGLPAKPGREFRWSLEPLPVEVAP